MQNKSFENGVEKKMIGENKVGSGRIWITADW